MSTTPDNNITNVTRRGFLRGLVGVGAGIAAEVARPIGAQAKMIAQEPPATPPDKAGEAGAPHARVTMPPVRANESHVHVNQIGYLPGESKRAVVPSSSPLTANTYVLIDDDVMPEIRYRGTLKTYSGPAENNPYPLHYHADFDDFNRPGRYRLRLANGRLSAPFSINANVYSRLAPLVLRYFDFQTCGEPRFEGRARCHHDDGIAYGGPRDGKPVDTSGGWHDAGDYLKFVQTTSYVTALMLFTYDRFHSAFPAPAKHGHLPVLLDYAKVGLDWLLRMHPTPDEFYYQVGDESDHNTWRLPEQDSPAYNKDWKPRTVLFGVGANLAGRTAAAFALAARLYEPYDRKFAYRCLIAAQSVYQLGLKNREVITTRPFDFYPEQTWEDDMEWGAIALYQATHRPDYLEQALQFAHAAKSAGDVTSVYNTHAIAHFTLHPYAPRADQDRLLAYLQEDAHRVRSKAENPYGLGARYTWGTAEAAAGAALTSLTYGTLTGEKEWAEIARRQRDFILGCNPFSISCLIGAGSRYPLYPHHQIASLKNVELSGAIIGGPADYKSLRHEKFPLNEAEFGAQSTNLSAEDDLPDGMGVYHDATADYVTNEPANDYTAKFLLLSAYYMTPA